MEFTKPYNQEKENKPKRRKNIIEDILLFGGLTVATLLCLNKGLKNYAPFSEQDYKNAKWYSSTAIPYNAYKHENIPHNSMVWEKYQKEVKKKNGGSLENASLYPDLDGDGKVAK